MITFRGAALTAAAILTFFMAKLTQVGWLYLLDALLWGAILISAVMPWLAVAYLSAHRRVIREGDHSRSPGPAEGETVQVELLLENAKAWPRFFLSVTYHCPLASPEERWPRFFVASLPGRNSLPLVNAVQCHRRGLHQFDSIIVESKAPFGLFRRRRRLPSPLSVLVYPQVHPLSRLPLLEGVQGTESRPRRTRGGQEISGSRHYFPGDPLRHIHWRNTARVGQLMVKESEDTQENTLAIAFDSSSDLGEGRETVLEYSIKLAASIAAYVVQNGARVQVLTGRLPGLEMPWTALLKELALLESGQGPGLSTLMKYLPDAARVLALVSETDHQGIEALRGRSAQGPDLAVVVLEGFGSLDAQRAGIAAETLRRAGVQVVGCRPGGLLETLRTLETTWSVGREVRLPRARK